MRLSHVVQPLVKYRRIGSEDPEIMYLTADSRQVRSGSLFVAIRGCTVDGHAFAEDAACTRSGPRHSCIRVRARKRMNQSQ